MLSGQTGWLEEEEGSSAGIAGIKKTLDGDELVKLTDIVMLSQETCSLSRNSGIVYIILASGARPRPLFKG